MINIITCVYNSLIFKVSYDFCALDIAYWAFLENYLIKIVSKNLNNNNNVEIKLCCRNLFKI